MKASFEGNAQTIRILTFLERKVSSQGRFSWGLNNTNRAIASVLKYDKEISSSVVGIRDEDIAAHREKDYVIKGFYSDDAAAIRNAKIMVEIIQPTIEVIGDFEIGRSAGHEVKVG